jgi:hypothetical protein
MEKEDQGGQDVEGSRSEGARRVQEAEAHVADVGRGDGRARNFIDTLLALPWKSKIARISPRR